MGGFFALFVVLVVVSLVLRFRRSRGDERQQLKWLTFAAMLLAAMPVTATALRTTFAGVHLPYVGGILFALAIALFPAAIGVAVLKYRLYDIDRIVSRTVAYGLLTALLAGVYAGLVLILGQLLGGVGAKPPSWAIAGATLAVAALFQPLRRRIQGAVDQRFNRRGYDAARTIDGFSARLRDEIDLGTLAAELLSIVDQSVQPTSVSRWLRPPTAA